MTTFRNQVLLLENNEFSSGSTFEESLIFGGVFGGIINEMVDLNEAADLTQFNKPLKFRGKFQEANAINKNKREYPREVLESNVNRLKSVIEHGLCGELDHPQDSIVHFKDASHKITKLWWEGNVLMGEGIVLTTPMGKILRSLINDQVPIGISSRGVGNGKVNENGVLVIGESYRLITFDAVADPSTYAAFQEKVVSSKKESVDPEKNIENSLTKNEATSIDMINKDLILACFSGIVRKQTQDIKARLR